MAFVPQGVEGVKPSGVADFGQAKKKRDAAKDGDKERKAPEPSAELLFAQAVKADDDLRIGGRQENGDIEQTMYRWTGGHWLLLHDAVARKVALGWLMARRKHQCTQQTARSALATAMDFMVDEPAQMLSSLEGKRDSAVIPVEGAYLRIEKDGVIRPLKPSRDFGLTYTVPATFDWARCNGDGTYTPRPVDPTSAFGRYLDRFMPDLDVRRLLQEAAAASVLPTNFEVAWVLSGSGSNGKSTFLHLLRRIHPFNTSLRLKNASDRFGFQNIAGKTLIIASEVPDFIGKDAEQNLKSLISRDPIEVEKKKRDSISIVPRATLFLALNEALKFTDYTYGNERKYQTIPFLVRMPKDSPDRVRDYHKLITDNPGEMAVVLDWILEGAARIQKQGGFSKLPSSVDTYTKTSRLLTDNVAAFLHENEARHDADAWTPKMAIYGRYKDFCLERTLKPVSEPSFWTRVRETYERDGITLGDKQVQTKEGRARAVQLRVVGASVVMER
jgi:P4 family phage/plasmid primase-like protien